MACVKADAYGHGLLPIARKLVSCGVDALSVASIDEAIALRKAGIRNPILVLGMILEKDSPPLIKYDISQTVSSIELACALDRRASRAGKKIRVHVKIDTGMGRIGVLHHDALEFVRQVCRLKHLDVEGIFTHLACADTNQSFTFYQIEIFEELVARLQSSGIKVRYLHMANSLGIADYPSSHFNMVRPGLILYGLYPRDDFSMKLKPVMSLKTRVVYVKKVPRGWGISYGHTYIAEKDTYIATLPIGYGDGYPRNLSNLAPVIVRDKLLKITGRVCMDQVMIDVGDFPVKVGDEVVLIGSKAYNQVTAEDLALLSGTIPYEIVCGLGSRVPRVYIE